MSTTPPNTQTAVAKPRTAMAEYFRTPDFQLGLQQALPKHCSADRFTRILVTALLKNPDLAECTKESLLEKCIQVAALGLECDGRRAHLIPFWNEKKKVYEVQMIVDYKGLVELIYRSREVKKLHADIVCENDVFVYNKGEIVKHEIDFRVDRGEPYAAYSEATMETGMVSCCVMSKAEIEYIRSKSKSKNSLMWTDFWGEGAKKTCIRRHSKLLPLSPDLREKIESDDDNFDDIKQARGSEVVAPNFLADAQATTGTLAPEQPTPGTVGVFIGQPAPAHESPKRGRPAKPKDAAPATPPPPIDVPSEVVPSSESPADIEPPPVEAPAADAQESEIDALLKANGVTWAKVAEKAKTFGWFGGNIPATSDELPEIQMHWLVKNVKGIAKNVLR